MKRAEVNYKQTSAYNPTGTPNEELENKSLRNASPGEH